LLKEGRGGCRSLEGRDAVGEEKSVSSLLDSERTGERRAILLVAVNGEELLSAQHCIDRRKMSLLDSILGVLSYAFSDPGQTSDFLLFQLEETIEHSQLAVVFSSGSARVA